MEPVHQPPPPCPWYYEITLNIEHIFVECTALAGQRRSAFRYLPAERVNFQSLLGDSFGPASIVEFICDLGIASSL